MSTTEAEGVPQKRLSERAKASEKEPRRQQSATAFVSGELPLLLWRNIHSYLYTSRLY